MFYRTSSDLIPMIHTHILQELRTKEFLPMLWPVVVRETQHKVGDSILFQFTQNDATTGRLLWPIEGTYFSVLGRYKMTWK